MQLTPDALEAIETFTAESLIVDVLGMLSSGKEATVFVCRAHPSTGRDLLAAKVYREEHRRSFTNDAVYLAGRFPTAKDQQALLRKRNHKGQATRVNAWIQRELDVLTLLTDVGVRVPVPVSRAGNAILMEYVGTEDGPAPKLRESRPGRERAAEMLDGLLDDVRTMLAHHVVHGDLSGYNVLVHEDEPVIIDVPQAVDARFNLDANLLLERDVRNVCRAFGRVGTSRDPTAITGEMWQAYTLGLL